MGTLKNQTALEWLYTQLNELSTRDEVADLIYKLEDEAKAMERAQLIEAWQNGAEIYDDSADQYFNETFGDNK
jgi:hypothetical protein